MSVEKVTLRWNEFEPSAGSTVQNLWSEQNFTDVTLLTEDGLQINAHKAVIASSSSFFKNILLSNPHQNPLLYLKDIEYKQLHSVMEFIYLGQTDVEENDLDKFLSTSKILRIHSLISNGNQENTLTESKQGEHIKEEESMEISNPVNSLNHSGETTRAKYDCNVCREIFISKSDKKKHNCRHYEQIVVPETINGTHELTYESAKFDCDLCDKTFNNKRVLDKHRKKHNKVLNDEFQKECKKCDYSCSRTDTLKIHIQSKHDGVIYKCQDCDAIFSRNWSLITHKKVKHEGRRFNCDQCHHKSTHLKYLKSHKIAKHSFVQN